MFDWLNEISDTQADLIKSFAIFYLIIVGNYIGHTLFTCFQIKFITIHKWYQFIIAFFLFYFLVTLVSNTGKLEFVPPIEKLLYSIGYFIGFILLMRLDIKISLIVLFLIFLIYFLELNQDFYLEMGNTIKDKEDKQIFDSNQYWITINWPFKLKLFPVKASDFVILNKIEKLVFYLIIFLLIIGFISYSGEVKYSIKNNKKINWINIISDTTICKLKHKNGFWKNFKLGLGIDF